MDSIESEVQAFQPLSLRKSPDPQTSSLRIHPKPENPTVERQLFEAPPTLFVRTLVDLANAI
jgi:hypothetical protein